MKVPFKALLIKIIDKVLPLRKSILFESSPDYGDNTKPVFDEMIKMGVNKRYKLIWMCYDSNSFAYPKAKNVYFVDAKKKRVRSFFLNHTAKVVICCNRFIGSGRKQQLVFYLCHGTPLKEASSYYYALDIVDYVIGTSDYLKPILARQLRFDEKRILVLGFPRTDMFYREKKDLTTFFGKYSKYVVWYPTVKTFKGGRKTGCVQPIQFIWNEDEAKKINDYASARGILIIVKPHFAQLTEDIKKMSLSNIVFVSDDLLKEINLSSYELIQSSDALLTDYSSIYSDYLILNKPIGLIWEDIDLYSVNPGLIEEYSFICQGGVKIYTSGDFCAFLDDVKNNKDVLRKERNKLIPYLHKMSDGKSAERVANKIIEISKIEL